MAGKIGLKAGVSRKAAGTNVRVAADEIITDAKHLMPLENKLADVRKALLKDLPLEELTRLQVHAELLENALASDANYHHHDTNQHHDHETYTLMPGLEPRAIHTRR